MRTSVFEKISKEWKSYAREYNIVTSYRLETYDFAVKSCCYCKRRRGDKISLTTTSIYFILMSTFQLNYSMGRYLLSVHLHFFVDNR